MLHYKRGFNMISRITIIFLTLFLPTTYAFDKIPLYTCEDLSALPSFDADYSIENDLDCQGVMVYPQGTDDLRFTGTIDGGIYDENGVYTGENHTIYNLTIQYAEGQDGGLFQEMYYATLQNINFENVVVDSDVTESWGLIAGRAYYSHIINIHVSNIKVGLRDAQGSFKHSGGIIGYSQGTNLAHVHVNNLTLAQKRAAGGLVGEQAYRGEIRDSSVTNLNGAMSCHANETPDVCNFGGLIGVASHADEDWIVIRRSYAQGNINSLYNSGGLIGIINYNTRVHIEHSHSNVSVSSKAFAGGLIGKAQDEYNEEKNNIKLNHVFAIGPVHVKGEDAGRGIMGNYSKSSDRAIATQGFYDMDTTGKKYSGVNGASGRSTKEMRDQSESTFSAANGWDRNIWNITDGAYPQLK